MKVYFAGTHPGSNTNALWDFFGRAGHDTFVGTPGDYVYDVAFTNNGRLIEGVNARLKVNTQHGNLFLGDTRPEPQYGIRLALAASESEKAMMIRNGFRPQDVLVTGQPRTDILHRCHKNKDLPKKFLKSKGLDPEAPTILYAPTYSRGAFGMGEKLFLASSINRVDDAYGVDSFIGACQKAGYNLVIRLHKYQKRFFGGLIPEWLRGGVMDGVEVHDNEQEPDSIPAMLAADLLVTDFSSITADFLALDKPIVFIEPHAGWKYTEQWHAPKKDRLAMGIPVNDAGELAELLKMMQPAELREKTKNLRHLCAEKYQPHFDGKCCERVHEAVIGG